MGVWRDSVIQNLLILAAASMIMATAQAGPPDGKGKDGSSAQQIEADPEDYFLADDLILSTGDIVPAGTEWYRVPDVGEAAAGTSRRNIRR